MQWDSWISMSQKYDFLPNNQNMYVSLISPWHAMVIFFVNLAKNQIPRLLLVLQIVLYFNGKIIWHLKIVNLILSNAFIIFYLRFISVSLFWYVVLYTFCSPIFSLQINLLCYLFTENSMELSYSSSCLRKF
jgi:hypothetical protein